MSAPIIVTATMGAADFAWADGLRRMHFPPERNRVPAHITLFHHLPPSVEPELLQRVAALCRDKAPAARLGGVLNLGNGVAYRVESPGLADLRAELAEVFHGLLTPQDSAPPRLHITIQNKVSAKTARALHRQLDAAFRPRALAIEGLALWHYAGGPWTPLRAFRFRG